MCLIPFSHRNCPNMSDVNCAPLSVTNCSGRPCVANIFPSSMIVFSAVMVAIGLASGHFEWERNTDKLFMLIKTLAMVFQPAWRVK